MASNVQEIMMKTSGRAKTPEGYTRKDIVKSAIEFKNPPRIPYYFNTHLWRYYAHCKYVWCFA